jgi:hypothetical protein
MGFWKTLFGLARRGFVGPPVLGLALIAAGLVFMLTPTQYVSTGFMVLTTPKGGGVIDPSKPETTTNPLLQFNTSLKTTAAILIQAINTPQREAALGLGPGSGAKLSVSDGTTSGSVMATAQTGPFIYVQVTSTNPSQTRDLVVRAEQSIRGDLNSRQQQLQAPPLTYLTLADVIAPTDPTAKRTTKYEYGGGALLLVLCLGFGGVYTSDRLKASRAARAGARRTPPTARRQRVGRTSLKPPYVHYTGSDAYARPNAPKAEANGHQTEANGHQAGTAGRLGEGNGFMPEAATRITAANGHEATFKATFEEEEPTAEAKGVEEAADGQEQAAGEDDQPQQTADSFGDETRPFRVVFDDDDEPETVNGSEGGKADASRPRSG